MVLLFFVVVNKEYQHISLLTTEMSRVTSYTTQPITLPGQSVMQSRAPLIQTMPAQYTVPRVATVPTMVQQPLSYAAPGTTVPTMAQQPLSYAAPGTTVTPFPQPVPTCATCTTTTKCVDVAAVKEVVAGTYDIDWKQMGSYAGYGGVGIGVIVFILLVIAVIVLWIRIRDLSEEGREYKVIRYTDKSKTFTLPAEDRNILFINETNHRVDLHVCPKNNDTTNNNDGNCPGGDQLLVKNTKCSGRVKIVTENGLSYDSGGISAGRDVDSVIASEFVWTTNTSLLRLT